MTETTKIEKPDLTPEKKQRLEKLKEQRAEKVTMTDRISRGFDRIALLQQDGESKQKISQQIVEDCDARSLYWMETVLSSLIATFGLLQNSVAVIIGAMLIAPLLRPIQGMAFGLAEAKSRFFWRSMRLMLWSVFWSVLVAYIVAMFVPIQTDTPEILARTQPNLFDLFIAIFSGIVALLSLGYSRLSASVAGVAMAASLMPPLSVVGIEMAFGRFDLAWGSLLLFTTNLVAILFVGVVVLFLFGFQPHREDSRRALSRFGVLTLVVATLCVPLFSSLMSIRERAETQQLSQQMMEETLEKLIPDAELTRLQVMERREGFTRLEGEIRLPERVALFQEVVEQVTDQIAQRLGGEVDLDLDIVRTASLSSQAEADRPDRRVAQSVSEMMALHAPTATIISAKPSYDGSQGVLTVVYTTPITAPLTPEQQRKIEQETRIVAQAPSWEFAWVALSQGQLESPQTDIEYEERYAQVKAKLDSALKPVLPVGTEVTALTVEWADEAPKAAVEAQESISAREEAPSYVPVTKPVVTIGFDVWAPEGADLAAMREAITVMQERFPEETVFVRYRVFRFETR